MNKKVPFAVIAGALAASALVAPISGAAQAPAQVESGLYFTNPEGGNGEFYSFTKWASLTPTEQSNLVLKYKPENIKIFNKVEDKLASLSATVTAESFDGAATAYTEGDIEGTFVDATTGDKIVVAPVVEEVTVESVSAINANQISVTFEGIEEAVTIDLEEALVEGENTVTFTHEGKEYTETVNYEAPDTEAPVLSVDGETTVNVENGAELVLPTVTAADNKDESVEVTSVITDAAGEVLEEIDTTVAGTYTVTYGAVDAAENAAEAVVVTVVVAEVALAVESVSAINANTISVTFTGEDAPAEAVEVTLEEALVDGQTEVTFVYEGKTYTANLDAAYVSPVTAATTAVEKAEGSLLEKDLADAKELVDALAASDAKVLLDNRLDLVQNRINNIIADVEAARSAGNQVALFNLLNKAPFKNADADLISDYLTALNGNTGTIAEIQAVIDAENAAPETAATIQLVDDAVTAVNAAIANPNGDNGAVPPVKLITLAQEAIDELPATISDDVIAGAATTVTETVKADLQKELNDVKVVAPVLDATNQINLLKALQNESFKRVNADLIAAYDTALDGSQITIADIQTEIDDANLAAAEAAVTSAQGSLATGDVTKAQKLVNNLSDDVAEKATEQGKLDRVNALITLKNAKTEAQVLAALKSEVLALDDINDAVAADYKVKLDGLTLSNTTNLQNDVVDAGNNKAVEDAVAAVVTNFPTYDETKAADQTQALKELNRLATVSAALDADTVKEALIEEYIDAIATDVAKDDLGEVNWSTATDAEKAGAVQTLVTEVNNGANETARTAAVNAATTPAEMRTALTAVASAENTTAYLNLPAQVKLEVAQLVLDDRNDNADKKFDDTAAITAAIGGAGSGAIKAHADKLATVNGQVTAGSEIADVKTALDNFGYKAYTDLDAVARLAVAEAFLNSLPVDADGTPVALDYKTIAALQADIDKAINAPAPMSVQAK